MCDGLVWAELGAAMPGSGGSYRYLREIYGSRSFGRLISFLFIWQLSFSAPLSVASGAIGLAGYASFFWPGLEHQYLDHLWSLRIPVLGTLQIRWLMSSATFVAIGDCNAGRGAALSQNYQYRMDVEVALGRRAGHHGLDYRCRIRFISMRAGLSVFRRVLFLYPTTFFSASARPCWIATYDYWGYYNVSFLWR